MLVVLSLYRVAAAGGVRSHALPCAEVRAAVLPRVQGNGSPTVETPAAQAVALPHAWPAGTRYHVEITKSREDDAGEAPPRISSTRTPIDVEVLERNDKGYKLRWTFGHPDAAPEEGLDSALVAKISNLVEGLVMDLSADATGSVTALVDPVAMEAHFEESTRKLLADLTAAKADSAVLDAVRSAAAGAKGAGFRSAYFQLASRFYLPSGATLVPGEKRTYEDRLPNPFGGGPLPAQASLTLSQVHRQKNEAVVEWRLSIDPAKAGPILDASIRAYAQKTGQQLPAGAALSFDAIEDAATYVYDLATGIPRSVVTTRTTVMAGTRRIDSVRYAVTTTQPK